MVCLSVLFTHNLMQQFASGCLYIFLTQQHMLWCLTICCFICQVSCLPWFCGEVPYKGTTLTSNGIWDAEGMETCMSTGKICIFEGVLIFVSGLVILLMLSVLFHWSFWCFVTVLGLPCAYILFNLVNRFLCKLNIGKASNNWLEDFCLWQTFMVGLSE